MVRNIALSALFSVAAWCVLQAQITVDSMVPVALCGSPTLNVGFTANGTYSVGNVFSVELSDATGSFAAPTVIGSAAGTGSGTISSTFPAGITGASGQAIRVVASDPAEVGDAYVLPITTVVPPNAGPNQVYVLCSNDAPVDLNALLGEPGATWSGPMTTNGFFDPAADPPGVYMYLLPAIPPCFGVSGLVNIIVLQAPDAGIGDTITLCQDAAPFSLLNALGGTPTAGGTWTSPAGAPHPNVFHPATHIPGCYTYTTLGTSPCANASASLCITVTPAISAGDDATINVCSTGVPFSMYTVLNGTPQPGGAWLDPNNVPSNGAFIPGTSAPGCYRYLLAGSGSCPADTAQVCVTVAPAPNAGADASVNWCQSAGPLDLFTQLGGTPAPGGSWTDLNATGQLTGNILNAGVLATGTYSFQYVVSAPSCADATATVTVIINNCFAGPGIPNYATE